MKQLSLTQARAKLSELVAEVDSGKGPLAIAQRSEIKVVLVNAEWHSRVEEELAYYRRAAKQSPLKLRGSMALTSIKPSGKLGKNGRNPLSASSRGLSDLRYGHALRDLLGLRSEESARQAGTANFSRSREWKTFDCRSHHRARRDGAFD